MGFGYLGPTSEGCVYWGCGRACGGLWARVNPQDPLAWAPSSLRCPFFGWGWTWMFCPVELKYWPSGALPWWLAAVWEAEEGEGATGLSRQTERMDFPLSSGNLAPMGGHCCGEWVEVKNLAVDLQVWASHSMSISSPQFWGDLRIGNMYWGVFVQVIDTRWNSQGSERR